METYDISSDIDISPENYKDNQGQQEDRSILGFSGDLETKRELGVSLPTNLKKIFSSFNYEIQHGNLSQDVYSVYMFFVDAILSAERLKQKAINEEQTILAEYFSNKVLELNTKLMYIVKISRGKDGFYTKMKQSIFKHLDASSKEIKPSRFGAFEKSDRSGI